MKIIVARETPGSSVWAGFILLSVVAAIPILVCAWPPILDYPNHLARMHILASAPLSGDLARYYAIAWSPIPDLAADAVVPMLARFMPVEVAMRIFLAATLLALAGGSVVLHRAAFQKWSPWPLAAFLLLYNRMLLWGFINYLAGLALTLWALAAWIALERRSPALRVLAGMVMATIIYIAHLAAFGCYAVAAVALSISPARNNAPADTPERGQQVLLTIFTLIPPTVLFLLSPTSGAPFQLAYGNPLRKFDLPVSIFDNYSRVFDGATFAVVLLAVIAGLWRGAIRLHPRLRWPVAGLLAAFILLPSRLLTASGIDHRLPIAIAFLFVASSNLKLARAASRKFLAVSLLALFMARMAVVIGFWIKADRQYEALLPAFDEIAPGAALAVAAPAAAQAGGVPLLHFPAIAAIKRDAFVPSLFADRFQQPIHFTDDAQHLAAKLQPAPAWQLLSRNALPDLAGYDDLMVVDPPPSLDRGKLPGIVVFDAPRLLLVRLNTSAAPTP